MQDEHSAALQATFEAARVAAIAATDRYRGFAAEGADQASERAALLEQAWCHTLEAVRVLKCWLGSTDPQQAEPPSA